MTTFKELVMFNFTGKDGLVAPRLVTPGELHTSENGLLFSSVYIIALAIRGELNADDRIEWAEIIRSCYKPGYPGLLRRCNDDSMGMERPDDFFGVLSASKFIDPEIAREILDYGRNVKVKWGPLTLRWVYNDKQPSEFHPAAYRGLMWQFMAQAKWVAGETPTVWEQFYWAGVIVTSGMWPLYKKPREAGGQDAWTLSWCMVRACGNQNWWTRLASKVWRWRFYRAWPHGIGEVYKQYFGSANSLHPFVQELWEGDRSELEKLQRVPEGKSGSLP